MTATAFVIMQVGLQASEERQRADTVLKYVISPVLTDPEFGMTVIRADLVSRPGSITPKMLSDLISAEVVIADLTGRNPNVYYELGIAHSFEKSVITLGQPSGLPFDIHDERVIPLPGLSEKLAVDEADDARQLLTEALRAVLHPDYKPTSPLTSVASRRALADLAPDDPIAAELTALREKVEEVRITLAEEFRKMLQEIDPERIRRARGLERPSKLADITMVLTEADPQ